MDFPSGGPFGVLKTIAVTGHTAGRAQFMLRTLVTGASTALVAGVFGSFVGSIFFDAGALPFVLSSSIGFFLGALRWYRASVYRALIAVDRHPALLRLHLDAAFPWHDYSRQPLAYFNRTRFGADWQLRSRVLIAWLSARDSIDAIVAEREKKIIEEEGEAPLTK